MGIDSVRAALQIVTGAGELTRTKALEAAANLLAIPVVGPTAARATHAAGQVSTLADELAAAASANREMVRDLVRQELEGQLQRLGLATAGELENLRDEVAQLHRELEVRSSVGPATLEEAPVGETPRARRRPRRDAVQKAAAKTTPAPATRKTAAKTTPARATRKTTAKTTPAPATRKTTSRAPRHD